jgi:hypothetical protein
VIRHATDGNQAAIVKALKQVHASVGVITQGTAGIPDLLVGWRGQTVLMEVKSSPKAPMTSGQVEFHGRWKGAPIARVITVDDALRAIGAIG